jgi:transposase-like protein
MRQPRRHFSADEKVKILRRRLIEHESVSDICNELNLQPTVLYTWQKQFFENGSAAFEKTRINAADVDKRRIAELEAKSRRKNEVVAELMEEHVKLKKAHGGP